jgi:hypothetical protein
MGAKGSSEASLTIYEVTQPKYLHWLSSLFKKKKLWSPQNFPVAKHALGNGQRMSNLVTRYAKRMRTNGQLFGETESVAVTCIYVDEITVTCIVECRKASECVQISCRFRVLDDINYLKANKGESTFLPNAPGFLQDHCCLKVPTLCPPGKSIIRM